jgi:hypothetical protein
MKKAIKKSEKDIRLYIKAHINIDNHVSKFISFVNSIIRLYDHSGFKKSDASENSFACLLLSRIRPVKTDRM